MEARLAPVPAPALEPVVSPELVLVDVELAAWAREHLDPPGALARAALAERRGRPPLRLAGVPRDPEPADLRGRHTVSAAALAAEALAAGGAPLLPSADGRPLRDRPARGGGAVRALLLTAVVAAIGLGAGHVLSPDVLEGESIVTSPPARTGAAARATPVPQLPPSTTPDPPSGAAGAAAPPSSREKPGSAGSTQPERTPPPTTPAARGPTGAAREFAWLPVAGASHYRVEFYRGERQILVAFPGEPRLTVAGTWTHRGATHSFEAGTYRWVVRPGFGARGRARYGAPTVSSTWLVEG